MSRKYRVVDEDGRHLGTAYREYKSGEKAAGGFILLIWLINVLRSFPLPKSRAPHRSQAVNFLIITFEVLLVLTGFYFLFRPLLPIDPIVFFYYAIRSLFS
jgi:hypothetical protein